MSISESYEQVGCKAFIYRQKENGNSVLNTYLHCLKNSYNLLFLFLKLCSRYYLCPPVKTIITCVMFICNKTFWPWHVLQINGERSNPFFIYMVSDASAADGYLKSIATNKKNSYNLFFFFLKLCSRYYLCRPIKTI